MKNRDQIDIDRIIRNIKLLKNINEDVDALALVERLADERGLHFRSSEKKTLKIYREFLQKAEMPIKLLPKIEKIVARLKSKATVKRKPG
jgi:hypothetical protein